MGVSTQNITTRKFNEWKSGSTLAVIIAVIIINSLKLNGMVCRKLRHAKCNRHHCSIFDADEGHPR